MPLLQSSPSATSIANIDRNITGSNGSFTDSSYSQTNDLAQQLNASNQVQNMFLNILVM